MRVKIIIYNTGLDRKPPSINTLSENNFSRVTSLETRSVAKQMDICGNDPFVKNYNNIINKKLINYITENNINICIFQELCPSHLDLFKFDNSISGCYKFKNPNLICKKLLTVGSYQPVGLALPKFISQENISKKIMAHFPHNFFEVCRSTIGGNNLYIINFHNRIFADMDNMTNLKYWLQIIGLILCIVKEGGENIIICGDNNSSAITYKNPHPDSYNAIIEN